MTTEGKTKLMGNVVPIRMGSVLPTNNTHKKNIQELIAGSFSSRKRTLFIKDENLRGGFAQLPNAVLRDPLLSPLAKVLYALLLSYAWEKEEAFPGKSLLAIEIGCSVRTITNGLVELRNKKLISWKRQGLGKVNIYYINRLADGYLPDQIVDKARALA